MFAGWRSGYRLDFEATRCPCGHDQYSKNLGSQKESLHHASCACCTIPLRGSAMRRLIVKAGPFCRICRKGLRPPGEPFLQSAEDCHWLYQSNDTQVAASREVLLGTRTYRNRRRHQFNDERDLHSGEFSGGGLLFCRSRIAGKMLDAKYSSKACHSAM